MYDVVVVGGGAAGLGAAARLEGRDVLLLEREARLGGRLKSFDRGEHWLNVGAHLLPGGNSHVQELLDAVRVPTVQVSGSKTAMFYAGRLYNRRHVESYPFLLPLRIGERVALARAGLTLMRRVRAWGSAVKVRSGESATARRGRLERFESGRTFAEMLGPMPEAVATIFRSAARRSAAEMDEQTAAVGLSIFGALWLGARSTSVVNVRGGGGALAEAWQERLGPSVLLGTDVVAVADQGGHVEVTYEGPEGPSQVLARRVIVAAPAPVARRIICDLPQEVDEALASLEYGAFVCLGFMTDQSSPMPWDGIYAITASGMTFDMLFNHAVTGGTGGSFMCYAGGAAARAVLDAPDEEIRDAFLADVGRIFPRLPGMVTETVVQKWEHGNVFRTPRTRFEPVAAWNERPHANVLLAGDYFGDFGGTVDRAAESGMVAAAVVSASLGDDPGPGVA